VDPRYEDIVCDVHLADLEAVRVSHGIDKITTVLDGYACKVCGCVRFFGIQGYGDLADGAITNVRVEPRCSTRHDPKPMYVQRVEEGVRWICPVCGRITPHRESDAR
jgi:hypothetical protein